MIGSESSDERGIALAVAIFVLVMVGALVAANFFAGQLEQQSGRNSLFLHQADEAAETGLQEALAAVLPSALAALPVGGAPLDLGPSVINPRLRVERQVVRLTSTVFLFRAQGIRQDAAGAALATGTLGTLARLVSAPGGGGAPVVRLSQRSWVQLY